MSNLELITDSLNYLKDFSINLKVYRDIENDDAFIVEANGVKTNFNAKELKSWLTALKNEIDDAEEQQAKKRRQFRSLLLEASEELARKYNKQVYTLSIGDKE